MGFHDFSIVTDMIHWGINHCFGNNPGVGIKSLNSADCFLSNFSENTF